MIAMRPNVANAATEAGSQKPVVSKITSAPPAIHGIDLRAEVFGLIQLNRLITLSLQVLDLLGPPRRRQHLGATHLGQRQRGTADRPAADHQQRVSAVTRLRSSASHAVV